MPWEGIEEAIRLDALVAEAMRDCTAPMAQAEDHLTTRINANFSSESAAGDAWTPLAPATLADRARKGFGPGPILHRTGDLRDAATSERSHGSDFAEVGAPESHPYAKYHASSAPRSKIPLRDFLAVDNATIDVIGTDLVEHFEKGG